MTTTTVTSWSLAMRWKSHFAATTVAAFRTKNTTAHARFASQSSPSSTPFPFPAHRNPTPHQIFHLPSNASQAEIKARCTFASISPQVSFHHSHHGTDYELARIFHPDSPASRALTSGVRHARFHAVTRAYDILRGKTSHARPGQGFSSDDEYEYTAELARRRRQHARRQAYQAGRTATGYASEAGADDAWKDQLIIFVGLAVRICLRISFSLHHDSPTCISAVDRGGLCPCVAVIA
jgi:hypothetical protein